MNRAAREGPAMPPLRAKRATTARIVDAARDRTQVIRRRTASRLQRPIVQDAVVAGVLTAAALVGVVANLHVDLPEAPDVAQRKLDALGTALILLQTVPIAWRRRAPLAVLVFTGTTLFVFTRLGYSPSLGSFGFLIALYTVAAYRERRTSIPAGVACYLGVFAVLALAGEPIEPDTALAELMIVGAAWWLGDGLRIRRQQLVQLEDRATRLEREREERAERAVAEERRVIARELHDVVAHNVSVIVAQAGAAQRIFDAAPNEARGVLGTIEHTGREALVEMRRLMGLLRTEEDRDGERSPQPGLAGLETLVAQVQNAGVPVTLTVEGAPRPVPVGLDLSAFRIVQEALTNVLKHAGPATADVVVRYDDDRLEIAVTDDGRGAPPGLTEPEPGFGQLGMRERVALFGGELRVRSSPDGGYEVEASLPVDGQPA